MIQVLGAIQHLEEKEYISLKNIETIYGTSAGAIVGVLLCLGFDWETINDYIIKRPWHDVFPIKVQSILEAYSKKGIFNISTIEKCFKPLLDAKDIPMDINLEDFYKLSNIELSIDWVIKFKFEFRKCSFQFTKKYATKKNLSKITFKRKVWFKSSNNEQAQKKLYSK